LLVSRYERARPLAEPWRVRLGQAAVALVIAAAVVGTVALLAAGITPARVLHKFNEPVAASTGQGPQHLTQFASSSRWNWWQEAWRSWRAHPVVGTGAGTFELVHRQLRTDGTFATEPHNLPLQFLNEGGIVGFILFLGVAFFGAPAMVETLRRLDGEARIAAAALVVGLCAYVIHGVVDFDWDFAAVTVPAVTVLGVLLAAGRPALARFVVRRTFVAATAGATAAAALFSLFAPWVASREVDDAYAAIGDGRLGAAISDAKSAHSLNPVAIDPLLVWATAEQARGNSRAAGSVYTKAIATQPDNWRPWYYRAIFLNAISGPKAALFDATQAAKRDPLGPSASYLTLLTQQAATAP
jgi:O-Antigen ligase